MVINAQFECSQKCGFSMIAATDNQCDSFRDSHTGDRTPVRKLHRHPKGFRRGKGYRLFHRPGGNPALPRQYRIIGNKCNQPLFFQLVTDCLLVFCQFHGIPDSAGIEILIIK